MEPNHGEFRVFAPLSLANPATERYNRSELFFNNPFFKGNFSLFLQFVRARSRRGIFPNRKLQIQYEREGGFVVRPRARRVRAAVGGVFFIGRDF
jgi:hypothetical protein